MKHIIAALAGTCALAIPAANTVHAAYPTSCRWVTVNWAGDYATSTCAHLNGGAYRTRLWCEDGSVRDGPKIYFPNQQSTAFCSVHGDMTRAAIIVYP